MMRRTWFNGVIWAGFALLTLAGGYAMLRACDLGILPLFGASACVAPPPDAAVAAERDRQDKLRADLHMAEIRLAQLPVCAKPPEPTPEPKSEPKPDPKKVVEKFELPKKVEDLKGCWQSARGDIDLISDIAPRTKVGQARFCYCFRGDGKGIVQVLYTDGDICKAPLSAKIKPDQVLLHHDQVPCKTHGPMVAADIVCGQDQTSETTCEIQNLGQLGNKWSEHFIRVTNEHCGWNG